MLKAGTIREEGLSLVQIHRNLLGDKVGGQGRQFLAQLVLKFALWCKQVMGSACGKHTPEIQDPASIMAVLLEAGAGT